MNRIPMGKLVHTHGLGGELLTLGELLSKRKGYMTQDEIIEMAKQAGFNHGLDDPIIYAAHERFAKLVAEKEREACALICDEFFKGNKNINYSDTIAICIRARNYQKGQTD
jgi:hypothetical protein